jgi:hypothetical protein
MADAVESGQSYRQVAEQFGVGYHLVSIAARQRGLVNPDRFYDDLPDDIAGRRSSRADAIVAGRRNGATWRELGDKYGITGTRAQAIFNKEMRRIRKADPN